MKVAIVGCGRVGQKRAQHLSPHQLVAAVDLDLSLAQSLAAQHPGCQAFQDHLAAMRKTNPDIVVIATPHQSLATIALSAIKQHKHVLLEKPGARTSQELLPLIQAAQEHRVKVQVGYNHRYHPAMQQAKTWIDQGVLGPLMYLRARYGHGGRLGYEQEWRANPSISGGGELIDQGVHLIDLARWFLGDFTQVEGFNHTYYWNMPVEDNSFLLLKTAQQQVAFLHASCTEWKNTFSVEIYGRLGKLDISGLGGSYGMERLTHYQMLPQMGPPQTQVLEYPEPDHSWEQELADFVQAIQNDRPPSVSLMDAKRVLDIVGTLYDRRA